MKPMNQTDFSKHISDFFGSYLPDEYGVTNNTIKTYSYCFTLLLEYFKEVELIRAQKLTLKHITKDRIISFLNWLETTRKCSTNTRNARLGAIHAFFKYLQYRDVAGIAMWQDILSIKFKKTGVKQMPFLSVEAIKALLDLPNRKTKKGRRDFVLIGLLYDSAMRVQELIDSTPSDIRFGEIVTIRVIGKGNKVRTIPLTDVQANNLKQYMFENNMLDKNKFNNPLFSNGRDGKLSRMAVLKIVKKYFQILKQNTSIIVPDDIGCHALRHSKTIHLLEANVNLVWIRDFLGHSSVTTTEVYARASDKMKKEALAKLNPGIIIEGKASWQKDPQLLSYLKSLQLDF